MMRSNKDVGIDDKAVNQPPVTTPPYPKRPDRYFKLSLYGNSQACYTQDDFDLLEEIKMKFKPLLGNDKSPAIFELSEEKALYGLWACQKPIAISFRRGSGDSLFTLPSRESKDSKQFPLWELADNMARQIANWQGERMRGQAIELMNDPVMLVLEEAKLWFFNVLSEKECREEEKKYVAARKSFYKDLFFRIPNFGPDRSYLREIQKSLGEASKIITNCLTNKKLPQYSSDFNNKAVSYESLLGTLLHFSLTNDQVAPNYRPGFTQANALNCETSPVCKIFKKASSTGLTNADDKALASYKEVNKFYEIVRSNSESKAGYIDIKLKGNLLDGIKFASFVKPEDKKNYLNLAATLESLINVRHLFERLHNTLPILGTYMFANYNLREVVNLASKYKKLVAISGSLSNELMRSVHAEVDEMLKNPSNSNKNFAVNLQALETLVAEGSSIQEKIEEYATNSLQSLNHYEQEMNKLSQSVLDGSVRQQIESEVVPLLSDINHSNRVLDAIIDKVVSIPAPENTGIKMLAYESADEDESISGCEVLDTLPQQSHGRKLLSIDEEAEEFMQEDQKSLPEPSTSGALPRYHSYMASVMDFSMAGIDSMSKKMGELFGEYTSFTSTLPIKEASLPGKVNVIKNPIPLVVSQRGMFGSVRLSTSVGVTPVVNGRSTESSFNQPLTLLDKVNVGKFIWHFIKPKPVLKVVSDQELNELRAQQKILLELKKLFLPQKTNALSKINEFHDQFNYVEKMLKETELMMCDIFKTQKAVSGTVADIKYKLVRVKEMMHKISLENRQVKKLMVKARRKHETINVIYDVVSNSLRTQAS